MAGDRQAAVAGGRVGVLEGIRIAVVEDDPDLASLLVRLLAARGAEAVALGSAEALYRHLLAHRCEIVILDVGLPGEDGYTALAYLRNSTSLGIVMLTGHGGSRDMARGLELGADLYLVKPVDPEVLVAGLLSLRRRLESADAADHGSDPPGVPDAGWRLEADGWLLRAPSGSELDLTRAERAFLQPLFAHPGQPVAREVLIGHLSDRPGEYDPHRLEVLAHRLRSRVRAATGLELPLRAPRGLGYLLQPV